MTSPESLIQALREDESRVTAPTRLERAVLAVWDGEHPPRAAARTVPTVWRGVAAAAASLTLTVTLTMLGTALQRIGELPAPGPTTLVFVGEPIREGEPVRVVRMRVPAATLGAIGVRSMTGQASDPVDVDLIVGEDGVARAIRLGM